MDFFPLCPIYRERLTDGRLHGPRGCPEPTVGVFSMQVPIAGDLRPGSSARLTWDRYRTNGALSLCNHQGRQWRIVVRQAHGQRAG